MVTLHAEANRNVTKITLEGVPDRPGIAAEIFGTLGNQGYNIELVVSTGGEGGRADISFGVSRTEEEAVLRALETIRDEVGARALHANSNVALVSIVGQHLSTEPGIAGRMFTALSKTGINIEIISTSMSSVTCLIEEARTEEALGALREEFGLPA
ncbi:MAG: ACT domain-containing protein [Candidatus Eisenbacteria bacterium]|nr:ACT domain-containing protein [Candidatus Latescibacterota bacterium]MBD3301750.1 ACT domain-containing protein [Candidatus Eisenbacteria bacterium]